MTTKKNGTDLSAFITLKDRTRARARKKEGVKQKVTLGGVSYAPSGVLTANTADGLKKLAEAQSKDANVKATMKEEIEDVLDATSSISVPLTRDEFIEDVTWYVDNNLKLK